MIPHCLTETNTLKRKKKTEAYFEINSFPTYNVTIVIETSDLYEAVMFARNCPYMLP
uniref:Uncharacterized protein n=1 Tax=Arundo donax TaxID=35708 RepID=A0A0A9FJU0_ARUDO